MFALLSSLLIYTENGHQYETSEKKVLNLVLQSTSEIEIPASVTHIQAGSKASSAFNLCSKNIRTVSFAKGSQLTSFGASLLESTSVETVDFTSCTNLLNIQDSCCRFCKNLKIIKLPPNVERIGKGAFESAIIEEITFPDTLKTIEGWDRVYGFAFGYSSLKRVNINPTSCLQEIGSHAFFECSSITEFYIPKKVTKLGPGIFVGCNITKFKVDPLNADFSSDGTTIYNKQGTKILEISSHTFGAAYTINSDVTSIAPQAFRRVSSKTVIFTRHDILFEGSPFYDSRIQELTFVTGLNTIPSGYAQRSSVLKKVTLPDNVEVISEASFSDCVLLEEVNVSKRLTHIAPRAFGGCVSLAKFYFPETVKTIQPSSFSGCNPDIELVFGSPEKFSFTSGILYFESKYVDYIRDKEDNDIVFPKEIRRVAEGMFRNKKLRKFTFEPGSLTTSIDRDSFIGSSINSIVFSPSIAAIGISCFKDCTNLESVEFDGTLTIIEADSFSGCTNLREVTFKASNMIENISYRAFKGCSNLEVFNFESLLHLSLIFESAFEGAKLSTISFPQSLTEIQPKAFQLTSVVSVTFKDDCQIETIPGYCFYRCINLNSCKLSKHTTKIEIYAFSECTSFTSFELGTGIEIINQYAFSDSSNIETVVLPSGSKLKNIMGHAFRNTKLSSFDVKGSEFFFKDGLLLDGKKSTLIYFIPNEDVNMVILPGSVESIGDYAFQFATNLREIFIPEGAFTRIGYSSFEGCTNLKRVTLPSTLTFIDNNAFVGCNKILCGGLFMHKNMIERAKEVGIQQMPLSQMCLNNYRALQRQKTCKTCMRFFLLPLLFNTFLI